MKFVEGTYGAWAHEYVSPDSAAGRLLVAGWQSVRVLAEFAARKDAEPTRRAWAFGVLYGIAGHLDPTTTRAMGAYEEHAIGFIGTGGRFRPKVDPVAQDQLAEMWATIVRGVEWRETK